MAEQEAKQRRPFHETVVDAIRCASYSDLRCLGALINETKIPKDHDEILAAWSRRAVELIHEMNELGFDLDGVLHEQKREAEKKEEEKKAKEQTEVAT